VFAMEFGAKNDVADEEETDGGRTNCWLWEILLLWLFNERPERLAPERYIDEEWEYWFRGLCEDPR
jgi:hypothetical protein